MTRDDIIRMAVECQLVTAGNRDGVYMAALRRFAALVEAVVREKVVAEMADDCNHAITCAMAFTVAECEDAAGVALLGAEKSLSDRVLKAIRTRGEE